MIWLEAVKEPLERKFIIEIENTGRLFKERALKQNRPCKNEADEMFVCETYHVLTSEVPKGFREKN